MKTKEEVQQYLKLLVQLKEALVAVGELSKKKPNDTLNKFKLGFFNQILETSNSIMPVPYRPRDGFEVFQEDDLPTNSDVDLMLSQYLACLKKYGRDNVRSEGYSAYWVIAGKLSGETVNYEILR
jgi:hypothetical protein